MPTCCVVMETSLLIACQSQSRGTGSPSLALAGLTPMTQLRDTQRHHISCVYGRQGWSLALTISAVHTLHQDLSMTSCLRRGLEVFHLSLKLHWGAQGVRTWLVIITGHSETEALSRRKCLLTIVASLYRLQTITAI